MHNEPTIQDVLDALQVFATHVDEEFVAVRKEFKKELKEEIGSFREEITGELVSVRSDLHSEISSIRSVMVTKEYLDDKISELRGDVVALVRAEDDKFYTLVDELEERKGISQTCAIALRHMGPFRQTTKAR